MSSIEITAKSLDEAKKLAAEQLGVKVDQLNVTVLEETKGLFGKGSIKISAEAKGAKGKKPAATKAEPEVVEEAPAPVVEEPVKAAKAAKPAAKAKPAPKAKAAPAKEESPAEAPAESEAEDKVEVEASADDEKKIVSIVKDLLKAGDLDAQVDSSSRNGKYVNVVIDGKDVAHLVGKHGEVLNAFQYLLNVIVTQQLRNGVRATLDGNNYRNRREEALVKLATQIANEVRRRSEEAVIDALPAFERRIIHKALSTMEGVTTYSEGEEPNRRVVIAPAE